jgi:hypothetical protein
MPALNFKPQFVERIRAGMKNHTIRADRAVPVKPGDKLYLYCGLRQKGAFRILPEPVSCTRVQQIDIDRKQGWSYSIAIWIDGVLLGSDEANRLADADGFDSLEGMAAFWKGRLPFKGQIIHWRTCCDQRRD